MEKPLCVIDYNVKSSIDLSDQMSSYNLSFGKTIKWYRKIAIELLLGTCLVNAHFLYKKINESAMYITDFRKRIIEDMKEETISKTIQLNCTNAHKENPNTFLIKKKELFIKPENTVLVATKKI